MSTFTELVCKVSWKHQHLMSVFEEMRNICRGAMLNRRAETFQQIDG